MKDEARDRIFLLNLFRAGRRLLARGGLGTNSPWQLQKPAIEQATLRAG
jgi:hypothetical protein